MKPNFALNITDSAVSLLHRTARGWLEVGSAAFDAPDLEEALAYMRSTALGLSPAGITTKLILPPGQILYTEAEAPGPDKAAREAQIRAALAGRTPYDVEELVFDWWGTGPTVQVAVVARETLEEAEAFAQTHRFNPVSFVTIPAEGQFAGEPWFGASRLAPALLPEGEKITRDQDPVKVITRDLPKDDGAAPKDAEKPAKAAAEPHSAKAEAKPEAEAKPVVNPEAEAQKAREAALARQAAEQAAAQAAKQAAEADQRAAEEAEATRKAEALTRAALEADAEAIRKTEAAKAEMENRAQALAQAEAKRLVQEAEKTKSAHLERERARAALIEAERKRAKSDQAAAEEAAAAFNGVSDPGIAETKETAPPPAAPTFSSRRREDGQAQPLPRPEIVPVGKPLAEPVSPPPSPLVAGTPKEKPQAPVVSKVSPVATGRLVGPVPKKHRVLIADAVASPAVNVGTAASVGATAGPGPAAARPLNGIASLSKGRKAVLDKLAALPAAKTGAKTAAEAPPTQKTPVAARVIGTSAALSRFKSKMTPKPTADTAGKKEKSAAEGLVHTTAADASMGKFGAKLAARRGKPRFLGLIMTLVLLAALAGVAAWSSLYLSRDTTTPATTQLAGEAEPAIAEQPADMAAGPELGPEPLPDGALGADQSTLAPPENLVVTDAEAAADAEAELPPTQELTQERPAPVETPVPEVATITPPLSASPEISASQETTQAAGPDNGPQDEIILATIDGAQPAFDAVALPRPQSQPDAAPAAVTPPPPFGTQYEFEPDGSIKATANGVVMPDGFWLIAARPPVAPPPRPAAISGPAATPEAAAPLAPQPDIAATDTAGASTAGLTAQASAGPPSAFEQDTSVESRRPRERPNRPEPAAEPGQADDEATLTAADPALTRLTSLRPRARPQAVVDIAEAARKAAAAASLVVQAAAQQKTEQESAAQASPMAVALSPRPTARPRDFSRAVEAAIAAATQETTTRKVTAPAPVPDAEEADEPEIKVSAAPRIPTHANVAKQATFKNAINLSKTNLIGVYGPDNKRYALIRSSSGRYTKVRVGDRVDGGTVAAITRNELRYKKGNRMLTLAMPKG
ncbi:hypothetical protein [Pseudorhodobacter sp.]|uniref:hypothetical protein n=1 Tax=Pseudorhodobacter sp. TaxID=1934400 RepID=UPI0039E4FD69